MDSRYYWGFSIAIAALAWRVVMHFVDKSRIKDEVETKLGRIVSIAWNPLGRGWFFEKGERHYDVTYVDRAGNSIVTACKTSLFTGVYWAEGPQTTEQQARLIPRHRCSHCGYALQIEWRACPNCAKATGFA